MRCLLSILFAASVICTPSDAAGREIPAKLQHKIDSLITAGLKAGAYPGVSFALGDRNGILYSKTYGYHDYSRRQPVSPEDIYDLASCTKVLSTTFVMMRLYDEGKFALNQTVGELLPQLAETCLKGITVQQLLTHTSGLRPRVVYPLFVSPAQGTKLFNARSSEAFPYAIGTNLYMIRNITYNDLYISREPKEGYRCLCEDLYVSPTVDSLMLEETCRAYNPAGVGKYSYVDANFYLLQRIAERLTGQSLDRLTAELYAEMGCSSIGFNPLQWQDLEHIIPTEEDVLLRRTLVHGRAHDELAAISDGVCGNAGLFADAEDISSFCRMILNNGEFKDRQILSAATIALFTASPLKKQGIYRGLGFDKIAPGTNALGSDASFGHTGYTGTIFWIDRDKGVYMVFLSNRVHPTRVNNKLSSMQIRLKLWSAILTGL